MHGICTFDGVFTSIDLTKANVHDVNYLKDVKVSLSDCTLLADKGYIDAVQQLDLFHSASIRLETPMRAKQIRETIKRTLTFSVNPEKELRLYIASYVTSS